MNVRQPVMLSTLPDITPYERAASRTRVYIPLQLLHEGIVVLLSGSGNQEINRPAVCVR